MGDHRNGRLARAGDVVRHEGMKLLVTIVTRSFMMGGGVLDRFFPHVVYLFHG